jgi:CheY-like chemotaxis protein
LALAQLKQHDVDLLLLDSQMPLLDGFETIRAIRAEERSHGGYLPAIAVTAYATVQDARRCREAGMDDYLPKPFAIVELLEKVAATARLRRRTVISDTGFSKSASSDPPTGGS